MFFMNGHSYAMTVFSTYLNGSILAAVLPPPQSIILRSLVSVVIEIVLGKLTEWLNRYWFLSKETTVNNFLRQ
jgi:hypothetical protein